jgi:hypothetical protein
VHGLYRRDLCDGCSRVEHVADTCKPVDALTVTHFEAWMRQGQVDIQWL